MKSAVLANARASTKANGEAALTRPRASSATPCRAGIAQTVKLLPQPQVVLAFGLRITNCAPVNDSV